MNLSDAQLAAALASGARRMLDGLVASGLWSGAELGRVGDRLSNAWLLEGLRAQRPDDAVLSEESADDPARLRRRRVWIVDPLDGTREFSEGRDDWAVQVALAIDGRPAIGALALPGADRLFRSDRPPAIPACPARPRLVVSRSRPPRLAEAVARALDAEIVPMGSVGAKVAALLDGRAEVYLHSGGQFEWDSCAPAAVALAAGFVATRLDGSPLAYNRADPTLPDLLVSHPALAARLRAVLDVSGGAS